MKKYPELVIDLGKLRENIKIVKDNCERVGVEVAGVIKGCNSDREVAKVFDEEKVSFIASSRINELKSIKDDVSTPLMLIRTPMLCEVEDVILYSDISLNSEISILKALNEAAFKKNKIHQVILMQDIGDLREGFMDKESILEAAFLVENDLNNLELAGVGTNVGCYGSICATRDKLNELVDVCEFVEEKIGRKLKYISGGASSSYPRILEGDMPPRINLLRIGEGILLANIWGYNLDGMYRDVFTLKCEVIEVKEKPTYPIGDIFVDAFGNKVEYEDIGVRRRALLGIGKADYAYLNEISILEDGMQVFGASSDHTIIDVTDAKRSIEVGSVIKMGLQYSTLLHVTKSKSLNITYKNS